MRKNTLIIVGMFAVAGLVGLIAGMASTPVDTAQQQSDRIAATCAREYVTASEIAGCHIALDEMAMDKLDREKSARLAKAAGP